MDALKLMVAVVFSLLACSVVAGEEVKVTIQGPTQVDSGGFALVGESDSKGAVLRWRIDSPEGANPPLELLDSQGRPVLVFMSAKAGVYKIVLSAQIPADGLDPFGEQVHRVSVGKSPGPGPKPPEPDIDPDDPNPPEPDVKPPFPSDGLAVLVVYETGDAGKLSSGHREIIFGEGTREFLNSATAVESDGRTRAYRIFDKDADISTIDNRWKAAMGVPRETLPWVVVSNGKSGFSGPLPATVNEFKALVGKFK